MSPLPEVDNEKHHGILMVVLQVLLYSTYVFMSAGAKESTAAYGTVGLGVLLLLATLVTATGFVERFGRKPLLYTYEICALRS